MALNPDHLYDVVAINAASASTQLAGLPFSGPIGGVRVALIKGQWVAFPTHTELEDAVFDMVVAGRVLDDGDVAIMMVEAEATAKTIELVKDGAEAPTEEVVAAGLEAAKPFIKALCKAQAELAAKAAKPTGEFPIFLDYQDDVLRGADRRRHATSWPRRSPSPASRTARPSWTGSRRWPPRSCSRSSRAARRRSPPPTAR